MYRGMPCIQFIAEQKALCVYILCGDYNGQNGKNPC